MLSSKPSKQRKAVYTAPQHRRRKLMSASLIMDLQMKYARKNIPVREGDVVQIVRGDYVGLEGKVKDVDRKRYRITIEGVTKEKADGKKVFVPIHPSKVVIKKLNLDDKWRAKRLASTAS